MCDLTALLVKAKHSNKESIELLLKKDADFTIRDRHGNTANELTTDPPFA